MWQSMKAHKKEEGNENRFNNKHYREQHHTQFIYRIGNQTTEEN